MKHLPSVVIWSLLSYPMITHLGCQPAAHAPPAPRQGILGKTTQEIGAYDPQAGRQVSDSHIRASDPLTAPLQAYGPILEQLSKTSIAHALELFHATEGRYPQSHQEFMERIIRENNIRLPVLPAGKQYQYDVANHQLVVVEGEPGSSP